MNPPSDRCGFELRPELVIERSSADEAITKTLLELDLDQWYSAYTVSCCWRPVWDDTERCIWHAESETRSTDDLIVAQFDEPDRASLDGADFHGLELGNQISFPEFRLTAATFSGADLSNADLWGSDLQDADLSDAELEAADLSNANLRNTNLSGAYLAEADLSGTDLQGADLSNTMLFAVDFSNAYFGDVSFSEAILVEAELTGEDLHGVNFSGAYLWDADLSEADLTNATLVGAELRGADLSEAAFFEANLTGADLRSATLVGAIFQETTLANVRMNQDTQIGELRGWVQPRETRREEQIELFDSVARAYHSVGEATKENGLIGKARRLRIWEREARRNEARVKGDWWAWSGSLLSEWIMGYGISISRISVTIVVVIFACAGAYWLTGAAGNETVVQALDYSVTIFAGIGASDGPPTTQPARSVAILESFAGILFSVLLGYVLGTREAP
jgi:uncharacterized protein YjbI with pentapeptide repeats